MRTQNLLLIIFIHNLQQSEVAQSCPTLCDPTGCSLLGSSIHGIFQARELAWTAISFSRGSSQPRDRTQVSCTADRCSTIWGTREATYSKVNYIYHVVFVNLLSGSLYFDYFQPIPPFPIPMYGSHKYDFFPKCLILK